MAPTNVLHVVVSPDFGLLLHGGGGHAQLAWSAVHRPQLRLTAEELLVGGAAELVLVPLRSQHAQAVVPLVPDLARAGDRPVGRGGPGGGLAGGRGAAGR